MAYGGKRRLMSNAWPICYCFQESSDRSDKGRNHAHSYRESTPRRTCNGGGSRRELAERAGSYPYPPGVYGHCDRSPHVQPLRRNRHHKDATDNHAVFEHAVIAVAPQGRQSGRRTGVCRHGCAGMDHGCRCQDRLHRAGQPLGDGCNRQAFSRLSSAML
jgi:hypothetical protein